MARFLLDIAPCRRISRRRDHNEDEMKTAKFKNMLTTASLEGSDMGFERNRNIIEHTLLSGEQRVSRSQSIDVKAKIKWLKHKQKGLVRPALT